MRYLPSALLPALFSIAGISIFTRIFDQAQYGRYAVVMAGVALVSGILSGWIQQSVLRYLPRFDSEGRLREFKFKTLVILQWVTLCLLVPGLVFSLFFGGMLGSYAYLFLPALLLVIVQILFLSLNSMYQARMRSRLASFYKILLAAFRFGFALVIVLAIKRDVVGLIAGAAAANLLLVIPSMAGLGVFLNIRMLVRSIDRSFLKMLISYGLPMIGWMLCGQVLGISDRFLLQAFRGSAEVGIYSANYNLVTFGFGLISMPILTACYPIIMNAWEKGEQDKMPRVITEFSRYYMLAVVPVVVFMMIFSREIAAVVLGEDFREGYKIIPLVLGGSAVWGLAMIGHKGMEIAERTRTLFYLAGVSTLANIVLNLVFIPKCGYMGAAATTFASYLIYPFLVFFAARTRMKWVIPWASFSKLAAAAVLSGTAAYLFRVNVASDLDALTIVILGALLWGVLFLFWLLALRETSAAELKMIFMGIFNRPGNGE